MKKDQSPNTSSMEKKSLISEKDRLVQENKALREREEKAFRYIREKINQLLLVMGTKQLKPEELDDETLISLDPIGIISDSFSQILEHLNETNEKLKIARDEIQAIFDSAGAGILVLDKDMQVLAYNNRQKELFLTDVKDGIGKPCYEVMCGKEKPDPCCTFGRVLREESAVHVPEWVFDGRYFDVVGTPIRDKFGVVSHVVLTYTDITNRKSAEEENRNLQFQLLQSQKLESIGRLAGGIAHDFNNILTSIIGYSEIVMNEIPGANPLHKKLGIIKNSGERAASLIKQLLAFSRNQVLEMKVVNLNTIIDNIGAMILRLIGEDIKFELNNRIPIRNVLADPSQIEQIVMNLVVNARDAMPYGGRLVIENKDLVIDKETVGNLRGVPSGSYVLLSVMDTGEGMSEEVLEKIFEPFFTTKSVGKGTGLGLSTVYGIVKQHNGHIRVQSTVGEGATFFLYFPVIESEVKAEVPEFPSGAVVRGTETVLLVEDEPLIRSMLMDTLQEFGFHLVEASSGEEALQKSEAFDGPIDLLLTDVIMPGMNGFALAKLLKAKRPGIEVIFISGYPDDFISKHHFMEKGTVILQKPLNPLRLATKMREILDGKNDGH